jgi:hypothetical protein
MRQNRFVQLLALALVLLLPAWAADNPKQTVCEPIAGVLMTNINAIPLPTAANGTNLGPVFGDLQGAVAATILGQDSTGYLVQHYWVTAQGDTIKFDVAHLKPSTIVPPGGGAPAADLVAVRWGDYIAHITGGTGKYANAKGSVDTFGLADFTHLTLVLRYRGEVCYER